MTEEIQKSAIFDTDKKYEKHLRNSIAVLEQCILRGEDVMIEAPMATRILLDFYYETLRRTLLYGEKDENRRDS
jgi:hypothetical protein